MYLAPTNLFQVQSQTVDIFCWLNIRQIHYKRSIRLFKRYMACSGQSDCFYLFIRLKCFNDSPVILSPAWSHTN
jgi:hypothetical protein